MHHFDLIILISVCTVIAITVLIRWLFARNTRIRNQLQMNFIFNNITHELLTPHFCNKYLKPAKYRLEG